MSAEETRKTDPYRAEPSTLHQLLEAVSALCERSAGLAEALRTLGSLEADLERA